MKPFRHPHHPARHRQVVRPAIAAGVFLSTLGLSSAQAAEQAVQAPLPAAADAIDAIDPAAPEAPVKPAMKDEPRPPADFEDVLREQDPAEVPLSLALMGGVLGILYFGRRKR